jgi:hypothetical protein
MFISVLHNIALVIIGIATIIGIIIAPKLASKPYKLLMAYLIITFINSIALSITSNLHIRNHFIVNIYMYLRFPLLAWIYHLIFKWQQQKGYYLSLLLWIITPPLLIYCLVELGGNQLHTPYMIAGSVIIILAILFFFYHMFASEDLITPLKYPFFWTSVGLFFFFLLLMPSRGIINILISSNVVAARQASIILQVYNCILYSLIGIDFIIAWKQTRKSASLSLQ